MTNSNNIKTYEDLVEFAQQTYTDEEKIKILGNYILNNVNCDYNIIELYRLLKNKPYSLIDMIEYELNNNNNYTIYNAMHDIYRSTLDLTKNYRRDSLKSKVIYGILTDIYTQYISSNEDFSIKKAIENELLVYTPKYENDLIIQGGSYDLMKFIGKYLSDTKVKNAQIYGVDEIDHCWNIALVQNKIYNIDALMALKERDGYYKHSDYKVSPSSWFKARMPAMFAVTSKRRINRIDDNTLLEDITIKNYQQEEKKLVRYLQKK